MDIDNNVSWDDLNNALERLMYGEVKADAGLYMADTTYIQINRKGRRLKKFLKRNHIKVTDREIAQLIFSKA